MFMFGIQIACQMTFTALGNAKASITVAIVRKFVLLIPLIFILPNIFTGFKMLGNMVCPGHSLAVLPIRLFPGIAHPQMRIGDNH